MEAEVPTVRVGATPNRLTAPPTCVGPGLRIDPLRLLAGCRKRRLSQAPPNLRGLI